MLANVRMMIWNRMCHLGSCRLMPGSDVVHAFAWDLDCRMTTLSRLRARAHEITLQYFELNR